MTNCDRLMEIIEHMPWETCESFEDGHFMMVDPQVEKHEQRKPIDFYLRVGTHMGQPVQAVIAEGYFLRFRGGKKWDHYVLHQINPNTPMSSVYYYCEYPATLSSSMIGTISYPPVGGVGVATPTPPTKKRFTWDPAKTMTTAYQMQAEQHALQMQQLQHNLQAQHY